MTGRRVNKYEWLAFSAEIFASHIHPVEIAFGATTGCVAPIIVGDPVEVGDKGQGFPFKFLGVHLGTAVHPGIPRIVQMEPGQSTHTKCAQIIVFWNFRVAEIRRGMTNLLCLEMS